MSDSSNPVTSKFKPGDKVVWVDKEPNGVGGPAYGEVYTFVRCTDGGHYVYVMEKEVKHGWAANLFAPYNALTYILRFGKKYEKL